MHDYAIFGGCFRSDLSFPELTPHPSGSGCDPDWLLRTVTTPPLQGEGVLVGEDRIPGSMHARLFRLPSGFRLVYDDTGIFDIPDGGRDMLWTRGDDANPGAARLDVIGYGFATLFHAANMLCLHGSAVTIGDHGVAFIAPKHHGKSTLARALMLAGAKIATDDAVPVLLGPRPQMRPGIHQLRLLSDSAERFGDDATAMRGGYGGKHVVADLPDEQRLDETVPLSAIYVLTPVASGTGVPAAHRTPLSTIEATVNLVRQVKGGLLLGGSEAAKLLDRAGDLAQQLPIFRLEVARDFERLDEVVEQIFAWHGQGAAAGAGVQLS